MSNSNSEALELVSHQDAAQALMPVLKIEQAVQRHQALVKFVKTLMNEGADFGKIPGTDKNTLLKPGAEKLTTFFGLAKRFHLADKIEDWSGADHGGEPFFYYSYRCALYNGELLIAESDGSCNSFESKYRWRKGERVCPACGVAAIIKGREEYGGGWICFKKKDGCGAKFDNGDPDIESQQVGRVPNPDVCDQVNTIQKMAQKRAFIGATLLAVNASEFFTQDVEDMVEEPNGDARPVTAERKSAGAKHQPQSNGKSPEEQALDKALLARCAKEKGEKNAEAYFNGMYGNKTVEQKRALVAALDPGAKSPQPEVLEGEIVEGGPAGLSPERLDIDNLCEELHNLGCAYEHVNAKIAKITGGVYASDEIKEADLPKVRAMLSDYLAMGKKAAAEMAKEFKKQ